MQSKRKKRTDFLSGSVHFNGMSENATVFCFSFIRWYGIKRTPTSKTAPSNCFHSCRFCLCRQNWCCSSSSSLKQSDPVTLIHDFTCKVRIIWNELQLLCDERQIMWCDVMCCAVMRYGDVYVYDTVWIVRVVSFMRFGFYRHHFSPWFSIHSNVSEWINVNTFGLIVHMREPGRHKVLFSEHHMKYQHIQITFMYFETWYAKRQTGTLCGILCKTHFFNMMCPL